MANLVADTREGSIGTNMIKTGIAGAAGESGNDFSEVALQSAEALLQYLRKNSNDNQYAKNQVEKMEPDDKHPDRATLYMETECRGNNPENIIIRFEEPVGTPDYGSEDTDNPLQYTIKGIWRNEVYIKAPRAFLNKLRTALENGARVYLETNMMFLVEKLAEFYHNAGDRVKMPGSALSFLCPPEQLPSYLSREQQDCVNTICKSPVTFVQGISGSGKTTAGIANTIRHLLRNGQRVFLTAPTNVALDTCLDDVLDELVWEDDFEPSGTVLRLGRPGGQFNDKWPTVGEHGALLYLIYRLYLIQQVLLSEMQELRYERDNGTISEEEYRKNMRPRRFMQDTLMDLAETLTKVGPAYCINRYQIVAATVDCSINRLVNNEKFKPNMVILDEAAYCPVIKAATLTAYGVPLAMLGDSYQLKPVFAYENLFRSGDSDIFRLWSYSAVFLGELLNVPDVRQYLAEKVRELPDNYCMSYRRLSETYRYGSVLAELLSEYVYHYKIISHAGQETKLYYINAQKDPKDIGYDHGKKKRISNAEADQIVDICSRIHGQVEESIGVIIPYRQQEQLLRNRIKNALNPLGLEKPIPDVFTVHRSQSREWDIVFFSITDTYTERFYTDSKKQQALRLLSTAISRAKKALILVGDKSSWETDPDQFISALFRNAIELPPIGQPVIGASDNKALTDGSDREQREKTS